MILYLQRLLSQFRQFLLPWHFQNFVLALCVPKMDLSLTYCPIVHAKIYEIPKSCTTDKLREKILKCFHYICLFPFQLTAKSLCARGIQTYIFLSRFVFYKDNLQKKIGKKTNKRTSNAKRIIHDFGLTLIIYLKSL